VAVDRFTIAIAGGVLVLVAVGLTVAAVTRTQASPPDLSTPRGVVLAYAQAEQRGDGVAAWSLLAASTQARSDHDRFLARVGQTGPENVRDYLTTEDEQITGDTASVVLARTSGGSGTIFGNGLNGYTTRNTVRLVREPAGWRITVPPDDYNLVSPTKP
jgi:hypothetical protein